MLNVFSIFYRNFNFYDEAKCGNADAFKEFFDIGYEKVLTGVWQPLPTYSHGANGLAGSIPVRPVFLRGFCMRLLGFTCRKVDKDWEFNCDWNNFKLYTLGRKFPLRFWVTCFCRGIRYRLKSILHWARGSV